MSIQPLHAHFIAPKKKQKLLGVIIDATRPYKTETAPDFIIKIKIIDETLNCNTLNLNNPKKYIHIFLYSKTLDPYVTEIGDIIYLKIFDVLLIFHINYLIIFSSWNFTLRLMRSKHEKGGPSQNSISSKAIHQIQLISL